MRCAFDGALHAVADFGLSRVVDVSAQAAMTACGTPAYSAPEVSACATSSPPLHPR